MTIMDLSTVTNIKELKSMAYDQLVLQQQAQQNLNAINQRIAEVEADKSGSKTKPAQTKS